MGFTTKEAAIKHLEDYGSHTFEGMNCGDGCAGWDGVSRRCECGNRRVDMATEQVHDGTWVAYGYAY